MRNCILYLNDYFKVTQPIKNIYLFIYWLCRVAYEILVPRPGIEPRSQQLRAWSPNHWTAREFPTQPIFEPVSNLLRIMSPSKIITLQLCF